MRRATVRIILTVAILLPSMAASLIGGELPREFEQQYSSAVGRLRDYYTHVTVSGTLKRELPQSNKSLEQKFVYRAAGPQLRLDVTTVANRGMGAKVGGSDMYMATRIGSLTSIRNPGSQRFDDARQLNYGDTKSRIDDTCMLNYPYTFANHATLYDFLKQPGVAAVEVKKIKRKSETLVKVSYRETAGREDSAVNWNSWFVLSPSEGWAVREYSRTTGDGDNAVTYRGSLSYDGQQDGVPLVKRIESLEEHGANRTCVAREVVLVSKFTAGDPDNQYFTAFDF